MIFSPHSLNSSLPTTSCWKGEKKAAETSFFTVTQPVWEPRLTALPASAEVILWQRRSLQKTTGKKNRTTHCWSSCHPLLKTKWSRPWRQKDGWDKSWNSMEEEDKTKQQLHRQNDKSRNHAEMSIFQIINRQAKMSVSRGNFSKITEAKVNIWIIFQMIIPSQRQQESLKLQRIPEQRLGFTSTTEFGFAHCRHHSLRNLLSKPVSVDLTSSSDDTTVTYLTMKTVN